MNGVTEFNFQESKIRTIITETGETLWVAKDVANALGYVDTVNAVKMHCKGVAKHHPLQTNGGIQDVRVIHEPDLYRLIIKSNLPEAQEFERWVFEVVLPTIRKTGSYAMPATVARTNEITAGISERLDSLEDRMAKMHFSFGSYSTVSGFVLSCCKTGAYGLCVGKDEIYSAYVEFTKAIGQKPEGRSNFCSKLYSGVVGAWASTLTVDGKKIPAIRGIDLLENHAVIINDFGARHINEMEAELSNRRRLYFGESISSGYLK